MTQTLSSIYYQNQKVTTATQTSNPESFKQTIYKNTYNINLIIEHDDYYPEVIYSTKPNHLQIY